MHPAFIQNTHPLATVKGSFNAVMIAGDNVGDIMLYGRGAGDLPTGSAIVSDIVFCARQTEHILPVFATPRDTDFSDDFDSKYYIRMSVADKERRAFQNNGRVRQVRCKHSHNAAKAKRATTPRLPPSSSSATKTARKMLCGAISEIKSLNEVKEVDAVIRVVD